LNDGRWTPFAIVFFPDGSDPTAPPVLALIYLNFFLNAYQLHSDMYQHNLPRLFDLDSINNLSDAESLEYYDGYYPNSVAPTPCPAERRTRIKYAIGCCVP
jgi:hypothetical protein